MLLKHTKGVTTTATFTIADLHLSTLESTDKSMEVFGPRWTDYVSKIEKNWRALVSEGDTVVIPGDISWALSLDEALADLRFIDSLPGRKILGKGNHDFWWSTMSKHQKFFEKHGIKTISFLFNNAHKTDEYIVAGTRGWYNDEDATNAPSDVDFEKLTNRETLRLRTSLEAAKKIQALSPEKEIVVFMHFPPYWNEKASDSLMELLISYGIKRVFFGHIHGNYTVAPSFEYDGITMSLISADYLSFVPKIIK